MTWLFFRYISEYKGFECNNIHDHLFFPWNLILFRGRFPLKRQNWYLQQRQCCRYREGVAD